MHNNSRLLGGEPDYGEVLAADPTSPQGLPPVSGGGEMDIGSADMPANLEASSAAYWLQAFIDKHEQYKAEVAPWLTRLKSLAVEVEQKGAKPPGTPPPSMMPPPPAGPLGAPIGPPAAGGAGGTLGAAMAAVGPPGR